ncbi:MAG TPA: molecular chaperone TorD family protein [candidate division Zixibacteria bacterium]|nr:molecular chaperone TorD family protein [candidate division Zixibacteria bacterium]
MTERETAAFRHEYYQLLVALFRGEPGGELLRELARGAAGRAQAARSLNGALAAGWEEVGRFLAGAVPGSLPESVRDEYTRLFIGPRGPEVNPYESYYLTGRLLDRPLAEIRGFLGNLGIEKQESYSEPEDALAFELEIVRWLIGRQLGAESAEEEERFLGLQADFLVQHLLVWGLDCARDIQEAQGAAFYRGVAKILQGFLELEASLLRERGVERIAPLEARRRHYASFATWKGPTFDPGGEKG